MLQSSTVFSSPPASSPSFDTSSSDAINQFCIQSNISGFKILDDSSTGSDYNILNLDFSQPCNDLKLSKPNTTEDLTKFDFNFESFSTNEMETINNTTESGSSKFDYDLNFDDFPSTNISTKDFSEIEEMLLKLV